MVCLLSLIASTAFGAEFTRGADRITFANGAAEIAVRVELDGTQRGAGSLELESLDDGTRSNVPMTEAQFDALRTLVVPRGGYRILVRAAHHRLAIRKVRVSDAATLGTIVVPAAPMISGVVKGATGAHVTCGIDCNANVDEHGRFHVEITGVWPDELVISANGRGTKHVALPSAQHDVTLDPITLTRAASLRINVRRHDESGPLDVAIAIREDEVPLKFIAEKRIAPGESSITIGDLDAGTYTVLVKGAQPLQRISAKANVAAGDVRTIPIDLTSAIAHARITLGGVPLPNADVRLESVGNRWWTNFTAGADGELNSAIWEQGLFTAAIRPRPGATPHITRVRLSGSPLAELAIDVPDRRIAGRVIDGAGVPVSGALVSLRSTAEELSRTVNATTGEHGDFEFFGAAAGSHALTVVAGSYLRPDRVTFTLGENDREKNVDVIVREGIARTFDVRTPHGTPSSGALLVVASDGHLRATAYTDVQGRAELATPGDEASTLYVFPKEGSLVIRPLAASLDDAATTERIIVPAANASLEVATLTTDGGALPDVSLLMRYNGQLLPPEVAAELQRQQGVAFGTNENGIARLANIPAGVYEFWPYRSEAEASALLASASALSAPIVVNVVTGENKATVRFQRK
ncbi:MAG TPA: carboxypeptidase-like regulatory domain-containing protein [Thermoanaerobaculia bacterium]|nr:carboxypeptidase-like regulatory domain-containing protein [Thermoanaerobaculia bacterium]